MGVYTTAFTEEVMAENNDLNAKCSQLHRNLIILAETVDRLGGWWDTAGAFKWAMMDQKARDLIAHNLPPYNR